VTNKTLLQQLNTSEYNKETKEMLLVNEDEEGISLSLYLDKQILENYINHNPLKCLDHRNVQAFCLILEGLSHFLYLIWNASHNRTVTLLEMELQAEVDKFIMILECMEKQSNTPLPGQLSRLLLRYK